MKKVTAFSPEKGESVPLNCSSKRCHEPETNRKLEGISAYHIMPKRGKQRKNMWRHAETMALGLSLDMS
jgi:hypothetical protein